MKYFFLILVACQSKSTTKLDDVKREVGQAVDITAKFAKENVQETRDEAVKAAEAQLQLIDQKMTALRLDLEKRNAQAKASAQRSLTELDATRAEAAAQLNALKADTEQQWRQTRRKINAAGAAFDSSFKDLRERLDKI